MVELSSKEVAALKKSAHDLKASVSVGKGGASAGVVDEVRAQLEREPLVKVKLLKSALVDEDREEVARGLAEATDAFLVEVRGLTVVLYKPSRSRRKRAE